MSGGFFVSVIFSVCSGPFASRLAPTGECISNVGASLLAKRPAQATQKNARSLDRAFLHSGKRLRILLHRTRLLLLLTTILLTRNRFQVDFNPTVLRPAIDVTVAGNRVIRTGATGREVGTADTL